MTQCGPLAFRATNMLNAEPMKKKKKADMTIVIQRDAKKRRRLEKNIRKLEAKGRKLKPIEEIEGNRNMLKTLSMRVRKLEPLSFEESESRALLMKQWTRYKLQQHANEMNTIQTAMLSQQVALQELRNESEELYQQAILIDLEFIPFERQGPVNTPPISGYDVPDGEYVDTTKSFYVPLPEGYKFKLK
ncbi:hypothetical protein NP493_73g03001 [Ridgeia piscesae]|uniref:Large ribosomal subunit protein mL40 n=1 Tax=Ridgeia piscesae TaxID=27915 RepID=A0AAD9P9Q2_RIDPI|nr:hypothetical protein NP493_73g03001 [Ridgeia piscesae]